MAENSYINNNSQNPSGIWQTIWGNLFYKFNEEMLNENYIRAWKTVQLLKGQIPPECEKDILEEYNQAHKIINKPIEAYTTIEAKRAKKQQLNNQAPEILLQLMGNIRQSLYDRKWINKDFSIHPREGTAKIRGPE